ncbi:MAG TPA: class I SAM-dependent methyltransferase [Bryobacteraceae bacterium]|nr:class I SAM-dependent methyltransferase [Bryobacteraceae bacterium]
MDEVRSVLAREIEYHERLYSGFAQQHFARPAVRALRAHIVARILGVTRLSPSARVLSLGCGIGDTELLLAPHVSEVIGLDLAPSAIRQAREDAARAGCGNLRYIEGSVESAGFAAGSFDLIIAIFFLHHVPDALLAVLPAQVWELLAPGGWFYSLDPSRYRLSGAVGSLLIPRLMRKYQSPDERELDPKAAGRLFAQAGFETMADLYDFVSTPLAGLFPGWSAGYRAARRLDDLLVRVPLVNRLGSNFEIRARKPRRP